MGQVQWDAPERIDIPGSSAYYTLVSVTFHTQQKVPGAIKQYSPSGHFTSWIRHIGSTTTLSYDDVASIIQPLPERSQQQFNEGVYRNKKGVSCLVYYLVGGESIQNALYQDQLAYIKHHFGIQITHPIIPGSSFNSRWPSSGSLASTISVSFGLQDIQTTQSHFSLSPSHNYCLEFKQGYRPPGPVTGIIYINRIL